MEILYPVDPVGKLFIATVYVTTLLSLSIVNTWLLADDICKAAIRLLPLLLSPPPPQLLVAITIATISDKIHNTLSFFPN